MLQQPDCSSKEEVLGLPDCSEKEALGRHADVQVSQGRHVPQAGLLNCSKKEPGRHTDIHVNHVHQGGAPLLQQPDCSSKEEVLGWDPGPHR